MYQIITFFHLKRKCSYVVYKYQCERYLCIYMHRYICKNLEKDLHISNLSIKFGLKDKGNY